MQPLERLVLTILLGFAGAIGLTAVIFVVGTKIPSVYPAQSFPKETPVAKEDLPPLLPPPKPILLTEFTPTTDWRLWGANPKKPEAVEDLPAPKPK